MTRHGVVLLLYGVLLHGLVCWCWGLTMGCGVC